MQAIKVVASTNIWQMQGETRDFPMWRSIGCNEYIIGYTDEYPTPEQIGEFITKLQHTLEGKVGADTIEVFTGYEIYLSLIHI